MHVYVLHSGKLDRYYVGIAKSVRDRLKQHLRGQSHWTSRADDWGVVFTRAVSSIAEARTLEKQIKSRGAARFINDQLPNPAKAHARQPKQRAFQRPACLLLTSCFWSARYA